MSENAEQTVTWLTQEAYDRLKNEHEELSGPARLEIAKRIGAAREEGDLKENGGYHAAKEEQGKMEARIRQLEHLLRTARVGEAPVSEGVAGPGMVVTARFAGSSDQEIFLIGSREELGLTDVDVYSAHSPVGKALTGAKPGATVSYATPSGKQMSVEVLDVKPYAG